MKLQKSKIFELHFIFDDRSEVIFNARRGMI